MPASGVAFVFFNCDEYKNELSMNIFYNNTIYKDTKISRKKLWRKVKAEFDEGRVKIADDNLSEVENIIISGNPVEASNFIQFGAIKSFNCV